MPSITIFSPKILKNKLKRLGIAIGISAALSGFAFYVGTEGIRIIDRNLAYSEVVKSLGERSYSNSRRILASVSDKLNEDQIKDLEAQIETIHPSKLIPMSMATTKFEEKIELLKLAYSEYTAIGTKESEHEADDLYLRTLLGKYQIDVEKADTISAALSGLEKLISDLVIFEKGTTQDTPEGREEYVAYGALELKSKLAGPGDIDDFCKFIAGYISRNPNNTKDTNSHLLFRLVDRALQISTALNPDGREKYVSQLLETCGALVDKELSPPDTPYYGGSLLLLGSLRELEKAYGYKIKSIDVGSLITKYATD